MEMDQEPPTSEEALKRLALYMALNCVRNTVIENYHCGLFPESKTGDYSDVKVVTPYEEIPWNEVSRISDPEMMRFNKEVSNHIYTFLHLVFGSSTEEERKIFTEFISLMYPYEWDEPKFDEFLMSYIEEKKRKQ